MIDNFALAVSHGLLILAVWRLLGRPDLDDDSAAGNSVRGRFSLRRTSSAAGKEQTGA